MHIRHKFDVKDTMSFLGSVFVGFIRFCKVLEVSTIFCLQSLFRSPENIRKPLIFDVFRGYTYLEPSFVQEGFEFSAFSQEGSRLEELHIKVRGWRPGADYEDQVPNMRSPRATNRTGGRMYQNITEFRLEIISNQTCFHALLNNYKMTFQNIVTASTGL